MSQPAIRAFERPGRSLRGLLAVLVVLGAVLSAVGAPAEASSLRGSTGAMDRQNRVARQHDYTFLRNPDQVRRFVDQGWLISVSPGRNYDLKGVSFPYARVEVLLFVERLSRQYRAACGERLVVTSLTRPKTHQPSNASSRSVHPTGMALDLRRSRRRSCRRWLEATLLSLERKRVLEAGYEPRPPHYHVAVFPKQYKAYVERLQRTGEPRSYVVRRGDSLWQIASKHATTVRALKHKNALRSDRIHPGQTLFLPE